MKSVQMPLRIQARLSHEIVLDSIALRAAAASAARCVSSAPHQPFDLKPLMQDGGLPAGFVLPPHRHDHFEVPPLGRRREDIPLLVSHFLEQATEGSRKKKIYSSKAIELLATHGQPGQCAAAVRPGETKRGA